MFLKILRSSQENICVRVSGLNLQLYKKRDSAQVFSSLWFNPIYYGLFYFMYVRFMGGGGGVKTTPSQVKILTKSAKNLKLCGGYTPYIFFLKIHKYHALSAEFLQPSTFLGQNCPKSCQNWTMFKLLYLGNKSK